MLRCVSKSSRNDEQNKQTQIRIKYESHEEQKFFYSDGKLACYDKMYYGSLALESFFKDMRTHKAYSVRNAVCLQNKLLSQQNANVRGKNYIFYILFVADSSFSKSFLITRIALRRCKDLVFV